MSRAKQLLKAFHNGEFIHQDVAVYQLYLESMEMSGKQLIPRVDVRDIHRRVVMIQPLHPSFVASNFAYELPSIMMNIIQQYPVHKVEWFKDGCYILQPSSQYEETIMSKEDTMRISEMANIPPKMVDTLNLSDWKVGYKMWTQTVAYPMRLVSYNGHGYWKEDKVVCYSTVKMITAVLTGTRMVTVTGIKRGTVYTF